MKSVYTQIIEYFSENNKRLMLFLFLLSFSFMFFFTQGVPFFFDDHEFHRDYVATSYKQHITQLFSLNKGGISDGPRPTYGLFFKSLFPFFGYSYAAWRIAKALVFSLLILVFYSLAQKLLVKKNSAFFCALFIMTLFPAYLQTFGYNGPHIFAELFKISAILLFVFDLEREKTSIGLQLVILLCALFAIRAYPPAYSTAAILPLFTLFFARNKILRYLPLFSLIILIQFPITFQLGALDPNTTGTYSPKLINMEWFLTNDFLINITNPIPTMSILYYKSVTAILTFFGFWLLIVCFLILFLAYLHKKMSILEKYFSCEQQDALLKQNDLFRKKVIILSSVWFLCELPYYIFLPEHAIRYSFAMFIPFSMLATIVITTAQQRIQQHYRKVVTLIILLLLGGVILTNTAYVYAFRAGWGSSFIAFEKGMDYFANQHSGQSIGVLYASGAVAEEYFYVNKSSETYTFGTGITYTKIGSLEDFSEKKIQETAKNYNDFYVIKRITSYSKVGYPDVPLDDYNSLQLVTVEEGVYDTLFDTWNLFFTDLFGISYEPNKIYVYKVML